MNFSSRTNSYAKTYLLTFTISMLSARYKSRVLKEARERKDPAAPGHVRRQFASKTIDQLRAVGFGLKRWGGVGNESRHSTAGHIAK